MYCLTQSPQTFIPISENPIPIAHRYGFSKSFLYLLLGCFSCTSFSVQNPIAPVVKVQYLQLVFAFQYGVILPLKCKAVLEACPLAEGGTGFQTQNF